MTSAVPPDRPLAFISIAFCLDETQINGKTCQESPSTGYWEIRSSIVNCVRVCDNGPIHWVFFFILLNLLSETSQNIDMFASHVVSCLSSEDRLDCAEHSQQ